MRFEYHQNEACFYPDSAVSGTMLLAEEEIIGRYGRMREEYLKEHKPAFYASLLMTGRLSHHLAETQRFAETRWEALPEIFENIYPAPDKNDTKAWMEYQEFIRAKIEEGIQKTLVER